MSAGPVLAEASRRSPGVPRNPWCSRLIDASLQSLPPSQRHALPLFLHHHLAFSSFLIFIYVAVLGFPGGSAVKNPPANAGDAGDASSVPRSGKSPRGGNGNPLQYSCLGNSVGRGGLWALVRRVAESQRPLSTHAFGCTES